jgi:hypothetical protein
MTFFNSFKYEKGNFHFIKNSGTSCLNNNKSRAYFKVLKINKLKHLNNQNKLFKIVTTHRECLTINITKDDDHRIVTLNSTYKKINSRNEDNRSKIIKAPFNSTQFLMDDFEKRRSTNEDCHPNLFEIDWNEHEM